MAKTDTATSLENARRALIQLEQEIAGLEQRRNSALLNSEPASAVGKIDQQITVTAHAIKTEQDRIGLLEAELKRQREQERLKDKIARIEVIEHKFAERDELGKQAIEAIKQLDAAYRGLFLISRELRDLWPWKMVDMGPAVLSEAEIERVIAVEYWRIGGRAVPTGGALPPADGPSLPNAKAPSMEALGRPGSVQPFAEVLRRGTELASRIMRTGASTGPIEGAAARAVGSSGRSLPQLLQRMSELADCEQTPSVETEYQAIVAELSAIPQDEAA